MTTPLFRTIPWLAATALVCATSTSLAQQPARSPGDARPVAPLARAVARIDTNHGDIRVDEYFWLRNRTDPDVIAYLEAENRYTSAVMQRTEGLQDSLYREMLGRIKQTDVSVPERRGPYYYYTRTVEGQQYPIFARKRGSLEAAEEVLLDHNELAKSYGYFRVYAQQVSPDHRLLAFTIDTSGAEYMTLMVKDLTTGRLLPDRVDSAHFTVTWAADNRTIFYSKTDSAHRPDRILRHTLGTPTSTDALVLHEPDVLYRVGAYRSKDDRYIFFPIRSSTTSEVHYLRADRPTEALQVIQPRTKGLEYQATHFDGSFLIRTNDSAVNFKVVRAPLARPGRANWTDVVPHRDSVLIDGFDVFREHLVIYERENALRRIRIRELGDGSEHHVEFPEPVYTVFGGANPELDTGVLRFTYTSLVTPSSVYDYDMRTRARELRKQTEVLGDFDPARYRTERSWARAEDGTRIPISLVYRAPLVRDGSRPLLLYAYGSYGSSTEPAFSSNNLSLLDRGVIYAIAHVRGGQEMGRAWYDQGRMLNKRNTFTDFIAAAEHLVRERYTAPERLGARGGSAGGLLMGAVVNMRPDLFQVVIADVPFVDVISTMLDASIPLTTGEWLEWGDPRDPEQYAYMRSYSPYDNVERKDYPMMLVTTGLNDPRVAYWEPAKWVARLRAMKSDDNVLLLHTNLGAGHGGSSGRYDALREQAFRYSFLLLGMGLADPPAAATP